MTAAKYHKEFEKDVFASNNGIKLVEAAPGYAKASMEIQPTHYNSVGIVHGGALFTLADFTFAVASNSHGRVALAIDAEISFFKALTNGTLTATAKEISLNEKLGTYLVEITNEENEYIAHFKGTVYRKKDKVTFE
ncbi:PaaI family thioesterase [Draconibacterium halophilum]|uniref:Hotdog fold thioesterase n=1 Tax=Draconibacterium halophilum TaxID=2706887 RepID=A0A6C0R8J7_9BACT|nr:hotdog fold thioesterase [Draconibacterium halophilum]QIA06499.1 hotdog fold thioesterase [Draconibacterium halophilum]